MSSSSTELLNSNGLDIYTKIMGKINKHTKLYFDKREISDIDIVLEGAHKLKEIHKFMVKHQFSPVNIHSADFIQDKIDAANNPNEDIHIH